MPGMGVSFGIAADTAQECADGLALLQQAVEVTVTLEPAQVGGHRWVARAVPMTKAPAVGEGLSVER